MDPVQACQRAVDDAREMITSVQASELTSRTPCESWDVRALLNHMIGVCGNFAGALQGLAPDTSGASPDLAGDDPAKAYAQAADAVMKEWRAPGALEKTLKLRFGEIPAAMGVQINAADQMIHTWDLAKALGRPFTMDQEMAAATLQMMQERYDPAQRGPGQAFAAAVECPDDAPLQDRLIALSGRQP